LDEKENEAEETVEEPEDEGGTRRGGGIEAQTLLNCRIG